MTDVKRATVMVNWAKNSRGNASGYSPSQWVLGRGMRMPWSLLDRAGQLAEHQKALEHPDFSRRLGMLTAARRAFEVLDTSQRLRRAWLGRRRLTPEATHLPPGTVVYIFRKVKPRKGEKLTLVKGEWLGPATVVGHEGASLWCSYRGTCTKCAAEHVRRASDEEMLAFQALPENDEELMALLFDGKVKDIPWEQFAEIQAKSRTREEHGPPLLPEEDRSRAPAGAMDGSTGPAYDDFVGQEPAGQGEGGQPQDPLDIGVPDLDADPDLQPGPAPLRFPPEPWRAEQSGGSSGSRSRPEGRGSEGRRSRSRTPTRDEDGEQAREGEARKVERLFESLVGGAVVNANNVEEAHAVAEVLAATARREKPWSKIPEHQRKLYEEAAQVQWKKWLANGAAEVIPPKRAEPIRKMMAKTPGLSRILQMRHMFTDKNDGKRSETNPLPVKADDRLIVPGLRTLTSPS